MYSEKKHVHPSLYSPGTVILLFQPAEEAGNGAKRMIGDGALENVDAIFAAHVSHEHPTGTIGSRPGPLLAGCGFFQSLQGIVSREANPLDSQVVSVTFRQWEVIVEQPGFSDAQPRLTSSRKRAQYTSHGVNDERMYEHVRKVAVDLVGNANFRVVPPIMGAEGLHSTQSAHAAIAERYLNEH
ncbi:IAA-amino acid hydrolase ILR1-like 6 [Actinidia rufa]|uniref:IAA-amino acid hydrolase ILR1-like 6 n=1 Tax=Actinidia rufa TaxID=165716 RepID=A0A7J0FD95_9ERIC|nr:IAA-amino acid hydrolase ILR1-like 6 [Actinidia rufa]